MYVYVIIYVIAYIIVYVMYLLYIYIYIYMYYYIYIMLWLIVSDESLVVARSYLTLDNQNGQSDLTKMVKCPTFTRNFKDVKQCIFRNLNDFQQNV